MNAPNPSARLIGTRYTPALELRFARGARTPAGQDLQTWVKDLPQRRWDPARMAWVATCLGTDPDGALSAAGFDVDISRGQAVGLRNLGQLCSLKIALDDRDPNVTYVYPRLYPVAAVENFVPASATFSWKTMRFEAATTSMAASRLAVPDAVKDAAANLLRSRTVSGPLAQAAAAAARASSLEEAGDEAYAALLEHAGELPEWFGLDLYPYQRAGAFSIVAGHRGLVDEPGLGKTRQALAFLAISDAQRVILVVPPVVLTNWRREVVQSGIAQLPPPPVRKTKARGRGAGKADMSLAPTTDQAPGLPDGTMPSRPTRPGEHHVVMIQAGRKVPPLPEAGVVVVSDSLIANRPALVDELLDWRPDAMVVDEAHRTMTWDSARSKAIRGLGSLVDGPTVTISGTPMFSSPSDLASQLALTGHLDSVFGGLDSFLNTYCRYMKKFDKWVARKTMSAQLNEMLMAHVWVRRTKAQVLPDLPKKARYAKYLDVDLKDFRRTHTEVRDLVHTWIKDFVKVKGRLPTEKEARDWLGDQLHLVTMLRRAAGLAKVEAAAQIIREHVAATTEEGPGGERVYTRPLIVWTHHKEVSAAMAAAVPKEIGDTRVIVGATSAEERGRIVDDFQAGKVPVLVASITAAGVGITLTRGCDAIFVETDWSPQLVIQAEDRQCRIGQERPVTITTLLAEGTLDPQVQAVQRRKIGVLEQVLVGGDLDVAVIREPEASHGEEDTSSEAIRVLMAMFTELVAAMPVPQRKGA